MGTFGHDQRQRARPGGPGPHAIALGAPAALEDAPTREGQVDGTQLAIATSRSRRRGATITASTDSADFAANLLHPARGIVHRITGTIPATIDLDINIGATLGASFWRSVAPRSSTFAATRRPGSEPMIDVHQSASPTFSGSPVLSFPGFFVFNGKRDRINKLASGYIAQIGGPGSRRTVWFSIGVDARHPRGPEPLWSPKSTVAVVEPGDELSHDRQDRDPVRDGRGPQRARCLRAGRRRRAADLGRDRLRLLAILAWSTRLESRGNARIAGARRIDFEHDSGIDPSPGRSTVRSRRL